MTLPIGLPISPMLAKLVDEIPEADSIPGGWAYEPKWDGFRCIICRDGDLVELGSRNNKPLTRYFPEVADLVRRTLPKRCVIDSELVVRTGTPRQEHLDWEAISQRIHPAQSRIQRLSVETPGELVCYDLIALDDQDFTALPYRQRRAGLEALFGQVPRGQGMHLTSMTTDPAVAQAWFNDFEGAGLDGVVAKGLGLPYVQGKRTMLKIKHRRTAEAVVIGYRRHKRGHGVGSLLLGMYDADGQLWPVGGIGAFSDTLRDTLEDQLQSLLIVDGRGEVTAFEKPRSRFSASTDARAFPLRHELVVEVAFDQLEGRRFRHAVSLLRFRPDREPQSCLIDQVDRPISYDLARVLDDE